MRISMLTIYSELRLRNAKISSKPSIKLVLASSYKSIYCLKLFFSIKEESSRSLNYFYTNF